jgi:colanic acid biosynthesis glycosyl transferase WcaI
MRVLVLSINYAPEKTAIAPFVSGLCEHLASESHDVSVVTAFPYYPEWRVWDDYRGHIYRRECINKVKVLRVWHFVPSHASRLLQRLVHDISFSLGALLGGLFVGKFDVIYCLCPPPTLAVAAHMLAKFRGRPYVIKLSDLASDAALATGIVKNRAAVRAARWIEKFAYRHADSIVCLCQGFIDKLTERGVPPGKLQVIPDWAHAQSVHSITGLNAFRTAHHVSEETFLVAYTGNIGKKQDLMNVVCAAELSQKEPGLLWLLVGHGEEQPEIEREIKRRALRNIRLLPLQPAASLADMYSAADVLLLNQKAAVRDAVIPSKLLTYMAAGRAVVAAVNENSEAAQLVLRAQCGVLVPAENPHALVESALLLQRDTALREKLGANGRAYAGAHFTKERILREYLAFFSRFTGKQQTKREAPEEIAAAG